MQRLKPFPNGCEFGLRGLTADAGLQPAFDFEGVLAAVVQRIFGSGVEALPHHRGKIEVRTYVFVGAGETLRRYANNVEIDSIDADAVVENRRIARKFAAPEIVRQHNDG